MTAEEGSRPLRLLIADDHAFMRRGIRDIIDEEPDMQVVAEAADGREAVERVRRLRPNHLDLVLMDVDMPIQNGIEATRQILAEDPSLPVIMLTVSTLDRDLFEASRAGAVGFLSKSLAPAAMVQALRGFLREHALPMDPTLALKLLTHLRESLASAPSPQSAPAAPPEFEALTAREEEVFALVARGARDREIGNQLGLTESTVKKHVQNILRKLDARNRTEAVARFRGEAAL